MTAYIFFLFGGLHFFPLSFYLITFPSNSLDAWKKAGLEDLETGGSSLGDGSRFWFSWRIGGQDPLGWGAEYLLTAR